MSVPSKILTCDRCGYTKPMLFDSVDYSYLIGRKEVFMGTELGWCHDCDSFRTIEQFDADMYWDRIIRLRKEIKRLKALLVPWRKRKLISSLQAAIDKNTQLLYILAKRKGAEKCLECGSTNVMPFDGDCTLKLDIGPYVYVGEKATGFIHPGCGGEFIVTPSPVRINTSGSRSRIYYDIEGNKL